MVSVPVSVLIPTKNEACNIRGCLKAVYGWADEIVVVDSQSTDGTVEIAESYGATVLQFHYAGGWPKKRQWALDTYGFRNDWILLLDADEILLAPLREEILKMIRRADNDGYWLRLQIYFLGRQLRFGGSELWKLSLFRKGKGRYERRLETQDNSMADMEVHEHIVVDGRVRKLRNPVRHQNFNTFDRYIEKHNAYSNWEAKVHLFGLDADIEPSILGTQAQRRRWLKRSFLNWPGSPVIYFFYIYVLRLGILDGVSGLIHSVFKAVQIFHTKAKIYEFRLPPAANVSYEAEMEKQAPTVLGMSAAFFVIKGIGIFDFEPYMTVLNWR
jgi:glycosyltransferase involved in cell wall biosynthesis